MAIREPVALVPSLMHPARLDGDHHHLQAIIVAIDQYAEAALGKGEFFLNKPYGIGGRAKDNIP
jgi:hypothetical protein